jgi:hypothetical protein
MSERPIAGRIWAGRLRVTARITAGQDFEFICNVVREAVYFNFEGEHPEHDGRFDLTVGVCDDMIAEFGRAVLVFPAVLVVGPGLEVVKALDLAARSVRWAIEAWYEQPDHFDLGLEEESCNETIRIDHEEK